MSRVRRIGMMCLMSLLAQLAYGDISSEISEASLHRWDEALTLYEQLANDGGSPFRSAATFGAAEMLRALGRRDEALKKITLLIHDKEWGTRAQLRADELYLETGDSAGARHPLEEMQPTSTAERRERRVLRGRLELVQRRPERA